jgi:hypothetical protein
LPQKTGRRNVLFLLHNVYYAQRAQRESTKPATHNRHYVNLLSAALKISTAWRPPESPRRRQVESGAPAIPTAFTSCLQMAASIGEPSAAATLTTIDGIVFSKYRDIERSEHSRQRCSRANPLSPAGSYHKQHSPPPPHQRQHISAAAAAGSVGHHRPQPHLQPNHPPPDGTPRPERHPETRTSPRDTNGTARHERHCDTGSTWRGITTPVRLRCPPAIGGSPDFYRPPANIRQRAERPSSCRTPDRHAHPNDNHRSGP